jgi:hypothetical protein
MKGKILRDSTAGASREPPMQPMQAMSGNLL